MFDFTTKYRTTKNEIYTPKFSSEDDFFLKENSTPEAKRAMAINRLDVSWGNLANAQQFDIQHLIYYY